MTSRRLLFTLLLAAFSAVILSAQNKGTYSLKVRLTDTLSKEPVSFATIYVSKDGGTEGAYYAMTDGDGKGVITNIPSGKYVFVAELMGYTKATRPVELKSQVTDLGEVFMKADITMLNEVVVSAVGNQVVVKKDTVEYTATLFKTTDNDMLEDLLKVMAPSCRHVAEPGFQQTGLYAQVDYLFLLTVIDTGELSLVRLLVHHLYLLDNLGGNIL